MSYTRTPYCFQTNYASNAYSGPSTSFNPTYERNGVDGPPSHCDTNDYHPHYATDARFHHKRSYSSTKYHDPIHDAPRVIPANLLAYIAAFPDDGQPAQTERFEVLTEKYDTFEEPPNSGSKFTNFVSKTASAIKEKCKKSLNSKKSSKEADPTIKEQEINYAYLFPDEFGQVAEEKKKAHRFPEARSRGIYFLARVDKKLYDAAKATKKAACRSGNFVLGRKNQTKSERWQDLLNKGYQNYVHTTSH